MGFSSRVQLHNTVLHATPKGSITGLLIIEMAQILLKVSNINTNFKPFSHYKANYCIAWFSLFGGVFSKEKLYPAEIADLSYAIETEEVCLHLTLFFVQDV